MGREYARRSTVDLENAEGSAVTLKNDRPTPTVPRKEVGCAKTLLLLQVV